MKLIVCLSLLLVAAYAHDYHGHGDYHGDDCGGDCLKACRSCGVLHNDGEIPEDGSDVFKYGQKYHGDCKEANCIDPKAVMIVDGHEYTRVVCFQGKWHFGFGQGFLEETDSAQCVSPGNQTCDADAILKFKDDAFECECKPNYDDVREDFNSEEAICTNCGNKNLNITLLIDNSGSMESVLSVVTDFITKSLLPFLKLNPASTSGNSIAIVTSAYSYEIKLDWGVQSKTMKPILDALESIVAEGQSYLGTGMEAVKAALVQPYSDKLQHKLIVFTDGSVKHELPLIKDITVAANNLEHLKVETFVIATNLVHNETLAAIANGVVNNIFQILTDDDEYNLEVANRLQKKLCV